VKDLGIVRTAKAKYCGVFEDLSDSNARLALEITPQQTLAGAQRILESEIQ
jgi:hypothetical protein